MTDTNKVKVRAHKRMLLCWGLALVSSFAHAGLVLEGDLGYGLNSLQTATSSSGSQLVTGMFAGATISKKPSYLIGFRFNSITQRLSATSGTAGGAAATKEWGPQVGMFLGKTGAWHVDAAYIVYASGSLTENGSSLGTFTGSGYQVGLGFAPMVSSSCFLGFKIVYHHFAAKKLVDTSSVSSTISYGGTTFMPSFVFGIKFGNK